MQAGGWKINGRLITSLMGNGHQDRNFNSPKIEAVYILLLVLMEIHAGGNQLRGDENWSGQLICTRT